MYIIAIGSNENKSLVSGGGGGNIFLRVLIVFNKLSKETPMQEEPQSDFSH